MANLYTNLFSPITVNGVTLRNRIIQTPCCPHFVQGDETFPGEGLIHFHAANAKGGAGVVVCKANQPKVVKNPHDCNLDIFKESNLHYFCQMTEAIKYYGAMPSLLLQPDIALTEGLGATDGILSEMVEGDGSVAHYDKAATVEQLEQIADYYAECAYQGKRAGFGMSFIHMAYRLMFPGKFLSPWSNRRDDEFGGDAVHRAQFAKMICRKIKERCGQDFLIEISCTGEEPELNPGVTIEDTIAVAKELEGYADFMQIRGTFIDSSQIVYLDKDPMPHLAAAAAITEALHASGCKTKITLVGGCKDPAVLDEIIRTGKADMIGSARGFVSDPEWPNKARDGKADEIITCLRCNKCHQASIDNWTSTCSVNPTFGIQHRASQMNVPLTPSQKVAVIGGGPAGMKAAIDAADRGHSVTLFEKSDRLGGLVNQAGTPAFKWPLKEFKDRMAHICEKRDNIEIRLNTEASPEAIKAEGFDSVVVAIGAAPLIPPIPGRDGTNVVGFKTAIDMPDSLGHKVVVVGGGEIGVETGVYLAENGHETVCLEMTDTLSRDSVPIHFASLWRKYWEETEGFTGIVNAKVSRIEENGVVYVDSEGIEYFVKADSVVMATGLKPKTQEAYTFFDCARQVQVIGDCERLGAIAGAMKRGFAAARQI